MQFQENQISDGIQIEFDSTGTLQINQITQHQPVYILENKVLASPQQHWQQFNEQSFNELFAQYGTPEIILIGTGAQQHFLHPKITAHFAQQGIGIEYMNTAAACRTLMILQNEGRKVWAWLYNHAV